MSVPFVLRLFGQDRPLPPEPPGLPTAPCPVAQCPRCGMEYDLTLFGLPMSVWLEDGRLVAIAYEVLVEHGRDPEEWAALRKGQKDAT